MKKLLLPLLLLFAHSAFAQITVNNSISAGAAAASATATISISAGHGVVVCGLGLSGVGTTAGTVTDSSGTNTYTKATASLQSSVSGFTIECQYSLAIPTGVTSVTYTPSGTATVTGMGVWDVTAAGGTLAFGSGGENLYDFSSTTGTDATTTASPLTITTSQGLIISLMENGSSGSATAGTGFTSDFNSGMGFVGEHKLITSSASATYTNSGAGQFIVLSGISLQVNPSVVTNGVVMSNGHPVQSGSSILYQ